MARDGTKSGGRVKGTPNKSTARARQAIAAFVDGNAHKLNRLLDKIEEEHGAKDAFNAITSLLEYHIPKIQRTEITGEDGGPVEVTAMQLRFEEADHDENG